MSDPASKIIGSSDLLGRLRELKSAFAETSAREEEVEKTHRLETARAKRECEEALAALDAELENGLAGLQSRLHNQREAEIARHAARRSRIGLAASNTQQRISHSVESTKGRTIGQVQSQTLELKRQHEAEVADLKGRLAEMEQQLATDKARFRKVKASARAAFRGFPLMAAGFNRKRGGGDGGDGGDPPEVMELEGRVRDHLGAAEAELAEFRKLPLPAVFRFLPLQWITPLAALAIAAIGSASGWAQGRYLTAGGIALGAIILLAVIQRLAARSASAPAAKIADELAGAADAFTSCRKNAGPWLERRRAEMDADLEARLADMNSNLDSVLRDANTMGESEPERVARQERRALERADAAHALRLEAIETAHRTGGESLRADIAARRAAAEAERDSRAAAADSKHAAAWAELEASWGAASGPLYQTFADHAAACAELFPPWDAAWCESWRAPADFAHAAPFARVGVDVAELAGAVPQSDRLAVPGGEAGLRLDLPLAVGLPRSGSVLFETESSGDPALIGALNNLVLRLLSVAPPGKLSFSIIDPVGLGQNFAGVTHLADYEDSLINKRIWTGREQIEARIGELTEHMEKVIQMYLRNEYETITEYNLQAGNIAEKYHFLVVADFPTNFSEQAVRGLLKIAASGARCGIYTLIHWDKRAAVPEALLPEELRKTSTVIETTKKGAFRFAGGPKTGVALTFDPPPPDGLATDFAHRIGRASDDSNRVEVPFAHIMPAGDAFWQSETTEELRVPIGRSGATKLQDLAIGKGTRQHALIAGKTGSGKSTLFHVMVTNLALHCSPDQVEFYLVDFKKGVEFKCYGSKKLPHAKVVAIESDREFGLSVLQRLDEELERRGALLRELGVQDVAGFKRAGGGEMPRTLLMIDEFQEFFVEDDKIAQNASVLLDRIVRQGRAFGIHVLLGSQTLGGAYSLARATLGQMVVRIALMCNEADAYLIMDEGNPAPRLLTRPGEGIYNDGAGAVENNSPFQTVWLPEDERDALLDRVNRLNAEQGRDPGSPVVFEGNAPADLDDNLELAKLRAAYPPGAAPHPPKIWLGAPNAIKGPTEAAFHRQSGNHLLVVGQRDDAVRAMFAIAMIALSNQHPEGAARFVLLDGYPPGSPEREFFAKATAAIHHEVATTADRDLPALIGEVHAEMKSRAEAADPASAPPLFVFVDGLQKFKKLRYDEDLAYSFDASAQEGNPALQFNDIITEGASLGIHLIVAVDTYSNIGRCLNRKALGEFEMRVLFQMSANDSAALVDSTKAGALGMHRALFYNEHEGYLETFRPYAAPALP